MGFLSLVERWCRHPDRRIAWVFDRRPSIGLNFHWWAIAGAYMRSIPFALVRPMRFKITELVLELAGHLEAMLA
jgi:hypothetical protein